jgi:hypothetical protein
MQLSEKLLHLPTKWVLLQSMSEPAMLIDERPCQQSCGVAQRNVAEAN